MYEFLTFKTFISDKVLIFFYYFFALFVPLVMFYYKNIVLQTVKKFIHVDQTNIKKWKITIIFIICFIMCEIFLRMFFEFLIAYIQIRNALI
jgi:hypothetical protein